MDSGDVASIVTALAIGLVIASRRWDIEAIACDLLQFCAWGRHASVKDGRCERCGKEVD